MNPVFAANFGCVLIFNVEQLSVYSFVALQEALKAQAIAARAIGSGALADVSVEVIRPYYQHKFTVLETALDQAMPKHLPWFLHRGEGAIFAWIWFKDLPITDWELYQQLKQVGVIAVPGSTFFPGLQTNWPQKQQCLRLSLTAKDEEITTAMKPLAEVVETVYQGKTANMMSSSLA